MKKAAMNLKLIYPIILAGDYEKLVDWYIKTFDLRIKYKFEGEENYTVLEHSGQAVVGIAIAHEMGVKPTAPRNNTAIIQFSVSDIKGLFERVREAGGKILFGPSTDEEEGYLYGGLLDIEGNQIWVVEEKE
ncbi:MAG: VOC family protein [candidate division WOR-3 bacterium]|nr:MAG: VOC family protein [candidate division WOR-3 bacterium]